MLTGRPGQQAVYLYMCLYLYLKTFVHEDILKIFVKTWIQDLSEMTHIGIASVGNTTLEI